MQPIPLFGPGLNAKAPAVTAKLMLNMLAEPRPPGEKAAVIGFGMSGDSLFIDHGDAPVRASIEYGDFKYEVHRGKFYEINNAGVRTERGTLNSTTGRVSITTNGAQVGMADGTDAYIYTIATTTFAEITDVDLFANPQTMDFLGGYMLFTFRDSGRFQRSALYNGLNIDSLNFANAESAPDDSVRVMEDHGEALLFGQRTTEFWGLVGTSFGLANRRASTLPIGLAAVWSANKFNHGIAMLGKNTAGGVQVVWIGGGGYRVISTPDIDTIINGFATVSDATSLVFNDRGHPLFILNFTSANRTLVYDGLSQLWSEASTDGGRWFGEIATDYLNKVRITDCVSGKVYTVDQSLYTHNGESIEREIITETVMQPGGGRFSGDLLRLEVQSGVGLVTGQGSDPVVMASVSFDDGQTWSNEVPGKLGPIGEKRAVEWRRIGVSDRFTFKFRVTDPVNFVVIAAVLNPEQ